MWLPQKDGPATCGAPGGRMCVMCHAGPEIPRGPPSDGLECASTCACRVSGGRWFSGRPGARPCEWPRSPPHTGTTHSRLHSAQKQRAWGRCSEVLRDPEQAGPTETQVPGTVSEAPPLRRTLNWSLWSHPPVHCTDQRPYLINTIPGDEAHKQPWHDGDGSDRPPGERPHLGKCL